ncbi:uncharacterized protein LOC132823454 [Hemiscyllium ocellatum]|uniref:uncharacterized protein LOC132823454 n=1 Tax=Hemiscyllium ocellatum TaxID=170820 RepID=UPI00296748A3|nr:uncharacterized protein LOC132823454 [Hemiscyllium ocellatum]
MSKPKGSRSSQKTKTPPPPSSPPPAAADVKTGLEEMIARLETTLVNFIAESRQRWNSFEEKLQKHSQAIEELQGRVKGAELKATTSEAAAQTAAEQVRALEQRVRAFEIYMDDLDNRNRRKNIRLLGLPEQEKGQLAVFLERWLPQLLNLGAETDRVRVEWAYRVAVRGSGPNQRPRPVLFRLQSYRERQILLDASRNLGKDPKAMIHEGSKIVISGLLPGFGTKEEGV